MAAPERSVASRAAATALPPSPSPPPVLGSPPPPLQSPSCLSLQQQSSCGCCSCCGSTDCDALQRYSSLRERLRGEYTMRRAAECNALRLVARVEQLEAREREQEQRSEASRREAVLQAKLQNKSSNVTLRQEAASERQRRADAEAKQRQSADECKVLSRKFAAERDRMQREARLKESQAAAELSLRSTEIARLVREKAELKEQLEVATGKKRACDAGRPLLKRRRLTGKAALRANKSTNGST
eukprot:TRINITY_DN45792_c0_g1_i1.p1 TRINITY_DN45792_c0_g1~~TRINITY_DN45792_c0_g1_i1.p1  ORF type:complete len:259 (+),score=97.74 TRINITY_DN45792_c0_g1_i1:50-778(+)